MKFSSKLPLFFIFLIFFISCENDNLNPDPTIEDFQNKELIPDILTVNAISDSSVSLSYDKEMHDKFLQSRPELLEKEEYIKFFIAEVEKYKKEHGYFNYNLSNSNERTTSSSYVVAVAKLNFRDLSDVKYSTGSGTGTVSSYLRLRDDRSGGAISSGEAYVVRVLPDRADVLIYEEDERVYSCGGNDFRLTASSGYYVNNNPYPSVTYDAYVTLGCDD